MCRQVQLLPGSCCGLAACAVLLLSLVACPIQAIYEDQAGTFDWYKQYVGRPHSVAFAQGKRRIFLETNKGLLAALHTRTGAPAWRRTYTDQDTLDKTVALHKPAVVLAASKGGKYLRALDALDGSFMWEALVFEGQSTTGVDGSCDVAAVNTGAKTGAAVAIAASDKLQVLNAAKGDVLWSADLERAGMATHKLLLTSKETVTVVAYTPGAAELHVSSFAADSGAPQDNEQYTAAVDLGQVAAVNGNAVAVLSQDGQHYCTLRSAGGGSGVSCQEVSSLVPGSGNGSVMRLAAAGPGTFSLTFASGVALVSFGDSVTKLTAWYPDVMAASPTATTAAATAATAGSPQSLVAMASSNADGSSIMLKLLDPGSNTVLDTLEVSMPAAAYPQSGPAPGVVAAWLDASKYKPASSSDKSGLHGCQVLLLWSDDQVTLVSESTVQWNREEALASGTSSMMIDLPAAHADKLSQSTAGDAAAAAAQSRPASGLLGLLQDKEWLQRWVRLQVLSVMVQFHICSEIEKAEYYELRHALSDNNLPYRDTNGFRKLIVLLTAPGKVLALHSGDGRIAWTSSAAIPAAAAIQTPKSSSGSNSSRQYLLMWRRFHDLTHAPQLAVLTAEADASVLHVLNGHTGEQLQQFEMPYSVEKVIPQRQPVHDGAAEQFSFLLVEPKFTINEDSLPRVHMVPDVPATQQQFNSASSNLFFWLSQQQAGSSSSSTSGGGGKSEFHVLLRGYGFETGARPDSSGLLPVVLAWQVVLPGQLLSLATRDLTEPLHSYVKVLGDRSLKYKYVNPNLLFVATGSSPADAANVASDDRTITVALLNTVTGGVLHQQVHRGAVGPVHAVASEHWVVYTFKDVISLRQQATVIELYDATPRDLSIEAILLGRTRHSSTLSSYTSMQLEVLTQSFYLQHTIKGLYVSQTKQGITTKQLLVHTLSDQLYALDKRFLDPRRPLRSKATPEEMEERLVPYGELIVFSPLQYATQNKQVLGLRGVVVAPAVLESTTLLFCYGTDIFFTRITPALHFDSLAPDFSYGLLVVALIALTVGTWFAAYSSQQTLLKAKWQ